MRYIYMLFAQSFINHLLHVTPRNCGWTLDGVYPCMESELGMRGDFRSAAHVCIYGQARKPVDALRAGSQALRESSLFHR